MKKNSIKRICTFASIALVLLTLVGTKINIINADVFTDEANALIQDYADFLDIYGQYDPESFEKDFVNNFGTALRDGGDGSVEYIFWEVMKEHNQAMVGEGTVLLKNDADLLPLTNNGSGTNGKQKVSVFSKGSADWKFYTYGAGDASTSALGPDYTTYGNTNPDSSLYSAFHNSDIFELNPSLEAFYNNNELSGIPSDLHTEAKNNHVGVSIGETPVEDYPSEVLESYKDYNDVAVVVLGRVAGEGADMPMYSLKSETGVHDNSNKIDSARNWDDHYLQLDADEVAMLQMIMDDFDDIVILVNASSSMELGFLDDPTHYLYTDNDYTTTDADAKKAMNKIKSALQIGLPGTFGADAIIDLLEGDINPSGRTADTWVRDFKEDPTFGNSGYGLASSDNENGKTYLQFDEDLYLGYRYYETRYQEYDPVNDVISSNTDIDTDEEWYNDQVVYPFGYGLSYTDFSYTKTSITGNLSDRTNVITAKTTVTNTGDVAGKEAVQLYYSAPYTDGGIQKAHVNLANFAKTDLLEANGKQEITITMTVDDLKSYDWNDANFNKIAGYEIEAGDYYFVIATDSHDAAAKVKSAMTGATVDCVTKINLSKDIYCDTDLATGETVTNLFDYISGVGFTNDVTEFQGIHQYMVRNDFAGTFPKSQREKNADSSLLATQTLWEYEIGEEMDEDAPWYSDIEYDQPETSRSSDENIIKLWHLTGRDFDDPLWDELLDQLTIEEISTIIGNCSYSTAGIDSIDKPETKEADGPIGVKYAVSIQWQSSTVSAQTMNEDLVYQQGILVAYSTYFNDPTRQLGGIYAPVIELHRSPFGGRNMESYSEDPVLAGLMCAPYLQGNWEKGVYSTLKHVGLNVQETDRGDVNIWASEAAIRELYMKPYEICIKAGNTMAMMDNCAYFGGKPTTGNWELNTGLFRNEWGFDGFIVTDMSIQDTDLCIRAGVDMVLTGSGSAYPSTDEASLTTTQVYNLRQSCKRVLYVVANSHCMKAYSGTGLDNIIYEGSTELNFISNKERSVYINGENGSKGASAIMENTEYNGYLYTTNDDLPEGLTLSEEGVISGKAVVPGTYTIKVTISENPYRAGNSIHNLPDATVAYTYNDIEVEMTIVVADSGDLSDDIIYNTKTLPDIEAEYAYSNNIASAIYYDIDNLDIKNDGITYELATGHTLPEGLTLSEDGTISGKCTDLAGMYFFTIVAESATHGTKEANFFVEVKYNSFEIEDLELTDVNLFDELKDETSIDVSFATNSAGYTTTYTLKEGTLPEGLYLSSAGSIYGTPTKAVTDCTFTITASAKNTMSVSKTFTLSVAGVVADHQTFDGLILGNTYNLKILVSGTELLDGATSVSAIDGFGYTVSLKSGQKLPNGFSLSADGTLVGTVSDYNVTFTVVVKAPGLESTDVVITILSEDYETELNTDTPNSPVDFDKLTAEANENDNSGLIAGVVIAVVVLSALAIGAVIFTKKRKK